MSSEDRRLRALGAVSTVDEAKAEVQHWHRLFILYSAGFPLLCMLGLLAIALAFLGTMPSTWKPEFLRPRSKWFLYPLAVLLALGPVAVLIAVAIAPLVGIELLTRLSWPSVLWALLAVELGFGCGMAFFRHRIWVLIVQADDGCWLELQSIIGGLGLPADILPDVESGVDAVEVTSGLDQLRQSLEQLAQTP